MSRIKHIRFIDANGEEMEVIGEIENVTRDYPDYKRIVKIWYQGGSEEWKPIDGFRGLYQISSHRQVKSLPRASNGFKTQMLKPFMNNGYEVVVLRRNNQSFQRRITTLVRRHFED